MWWQFKKVHPPVKLHLGHGVDIQLFVRVDGHKQGTDVCLRGEETVGKLLPQHSDGSEKGSQVHQGIMQNNWERGYRNCSEKRQKPTKNPATDITISKPIPTPSKTSAVKRS